MIDLEIALVKVFGWSLNDIDETDIESLLPFIKRLTDDDRPGSKQKKVYCDEVDFL